MGELTLALRPWWVSDAAQLNELKQAVALHAPRLRLSIGDDQLIARGPYSLNAGGEALDTFAIEIHYNPSDATAEPKVWEIGGAIERIEDNHISVGDGACCVGVYDEWLALTGDASFAGFLDGPLKNFFLSQAIFRRKKIWIFNQRPHGIPGMIEAYNELIGANFDSEDSVARTLSFLSLGQQRGHWLCPCGSGKRYRACCRSQLQKCLISPGMANRLFERLANEVVKVQGQEARERLRYRKQ